MADLTTRYPHHAAGKVTAEIRAQMDEANRRFGVTDGALVRMALEDYLPRYLAAQGQTANLDLLAKVGAAVKSRPDLAPEIHTLIKRSIRAGRKAA